MSQRNVVKQNLSTRQTIEYHYNSHFAHSCLTMNEPTTPPEAQASKSAIPEKKQESLLLNLLFNIILPTVILMKLSGDEWLGTKLAVIVALAFPIIYGIRDFAKTGKINFFSALGVLSVVLTGGISLLELDPKYIAIKEAAVPALFGIATVLSLKTRYPLVKTFLYNDKVLATDQIADALSRNNNQVAFERALYNASWMLAGSFFLSSGLNYLLATILITADAGTQEFNEQLGKMTGLSFPVIAVPAMIIMLATFFYLFRQITRLTGLTLDQVMQQPPVKEN